ncbi:MAG: hypothetical protein QOH50_2960 [Kribbellaceae bacterium]|nr:hypothetical protein [Kribbellaceae bacterium]
MNHDSRRSSARVDNNQSRSDLRKRGRRAAQHALLGRSTVRGRPRTTSKRDDPCVRCGRNTPRLAATWPEGRLCNVRYFNAIHAFKNGCCRSVQRRLAADLLDVRCDPLRLPL